MQNYLDIVKQYWIDEEIVSFKPFGSGHINSTFEIKCTDKRYLFQIVNTNVFKNPDELMNNIFLVTETLAEMFEKTKTDEQVMRVIKTKDGQLYKTVDGETFRVLTFIEDSMSFDIAESAEDFKNLGFAFGRFAMNLDGFDAKKLNEVIPNFHNTVDRYNKFVEAIKNDKSGRASLVSKEISFYLSREKICNKITSLLDSGAMPTRVTHNDTKINNILFSKTTGLPISIVDLDTVMPGSVCYDFGDSIRSGCNTGAEDEPDLSKVDFSVDLYKAYAEGYLKGFTKITEIEKSHLLWGAILMTYECGMRFLTDYLDGDVYFKTTHPEHNLERTRTQIKLVTIMEEKFDELQNITMSY